MEDHSKKTESYHKNKDPDGLFPFLKKVVPNVKLYKNLSTISQGNAEGARILVEHHHDDDDNAADAAEHKEESAKTTTPYKTTELFVKRIQVSNYAHKSWTDLRRTLVYGRTEARFYKDVLPWMESKGYLQQFPNLVPKCHLVEYDFDGLLSEEEHAVLVNDAGTTTTTKSSSSSTKDGRNDDAKDDKEKGATFILDSICSTKYFQDSPLEPHQVRKCLSTVAKLHACAWEEEEILHIAKERLSVTSYHLPFRNPKELEMMEESWTKFTTAFCTSSPKAKELFAKPSIQILGKRIKDIAHYVSNELSPTATDKYATLVHGDYKSMNVFLPVSVNQDTNGEEENSSDDAIMIDFASVGVGFGMCDVAMNITHALHPQHLKDGQEERLVEYYLEQLEMAFENKSSSSKKLSYPKEIAFRHYKLAVIDYFRFVLGRFWKSATPESFEAKKNTKNRTLPNRNADSAFAFIERVDRYLVDFEKEQ
mmetsp:Transcript_7682/g.10958  ORF Transcript_7682/g.10958 Transcript_7682/m.10958 type:complete len:480 (-) Transcript_7682:80-1519(-)